MDAAGSRWRAARVDSKVFTFSVSPGKYLGGQPQVGIGHVEMDMRGIVFSTVPDKIRA